MVDFTTMCIYERALICLYGFCKHKMLKLPQKKQGGQTAKKQGGETAKKQAVSADIPAYIVKRTISRFNTSKYLLHVYKKYYAVCENGETAFNYVVKELNNTVDPDMDDLLFESLNGIIEGGENVDLQIEKAYHNLHKFHDQGKRQVYISEDTLIKADNQAFFNMIKESNSIDKYKQVLTENECVVLDIIINQPITIKGRTDGRANVSIRAVAAEYGRSISTTQKTVKQIRDKIYKIASECDYLKM